MERKWGVVGLVLAVVAPSCGSRGPLAGPETADDGGPGDASQGFEPPPPPCVLAEAPARTRVEDISPGGLVAYGVPAGSSNVDVWVVADCGEATVLALRSVAYAQFGGETLVGFREDDSSIEGDWAAEMVGWHLGDTDETPLATNVDTGAVHFSRDGRYLSVEANDMDADNRNEVDLLLYRVSDFSIVATASLSQARGRFTRDSAWWVYSGSTQDRVERYTVWRLPVGGGTRERVTGFDMDARWELSDDAEWLVHGDDGSLVRTPLAGGTTEVLAPGLAPSDEGKELDLSSGDGHVAFLQYANPSTALATLPFGGGDVETLVAGGVSEILDYHTQVLIFETEADPDRLALVDPNGGLPLDLGASSVVDEDDRLLLAQSGADLRIVPLPPTATVMFLGDVTSAAIAPAGRIALTRASAPHELELVEPGSGSHFTLLAATASRFSMEPERRWLVTLAPEPAGGELLLKVFLPGS